MATEVTETVGIVPVEESEDDNAADATGTESEGLVTGTESDEYADTTDPEFSDSDDDKKSGSSRNLGRRRGSRRMERSGSSTKRR
mmetsp:Transcript_14670/g.30511  ORF Transcript_14670/g.30511 Transcript_14670/m.30511 type:complete len:85 (+) Transcript_14670:234-488(+)